MTEHEKQYHNERIVRISSSSSTSAANDGQSITLEGKLNLLPTETKGIVLFAHGSGSSRHSTRNNYVAQVLHNAGIATLLVDLLTPEEEDADIRTQNILYKLPPGIVLNKFNIKLLANRLIAATNWIMEDPDTQHLINNIGYFGASTGSAAALIAAATYVGRPSAISAIVSRGGRPDLAGLEALSKVQAPTLLIVGGNDAKPVIDLNNNALKQLKNVQKKKLVIIPGATHLFEEAGTLEEVARLASGWFGCYFLIKKHSSSSNQ
jgi:putative phosphoribosyl transferase